MKKTAERYRMVRAFAVWRGELYDGGRYGIYRTRDNYHVLVDYKVYRMLSVRRSVLRGLI